MKRSGGLMHALGIALNFFGKTMIGISLVWVLLVGIIFPGAYLINPNSVGQAEVEYNFTVLIGMALLGLFSLSCAKLISWIVRDPAS